MDVLHLQPIINIEIVEFEEGIGSYLLVKLIVLWSSFYQPVLSSQAQLKIIVHQIWIYNLNI